jgi:hypothetical protein
LIVAPLSPGFAFEIGCYQRHVVVHINPAPDHRIAETRQTTRPAVDEFVPGGEHLAAKAAGSHNTARDRPNRPAVIFAPKEALKKGLPL